MTAVLGIDLGGTGARVIIAPLADTDRAEAPLLRVGEDQTDPASAGLPEGSLAARLSAALAVAAARQSELYRQVAVICVGATGMAMRVPDKDALAALITDEYTRLRPAAERASSGRPANGSLRSGARQVAHRPGPPSGALRLVLATDAVTAHAATLRGAPGVVCALGTGAVALATDWQQHWRRVDGWGHLLGDRGGGAWVATRALQTALRWYDVIPTWFDGSALFAAARERWGEPQMWPSQLPARPDRAGELATFVPEVVRVARAGDAAARQILQEAGRQAAHSTLAALSAPRATNRTDETGGAAGDAGAVGDPIARARVTAAAGDADAAVRAHRAVVAPVVSLDESEPVVGRTGGMFRIREVAGSFDATIMDHVPGAQLVAADAEPVTGAVRLARLAADGRLAEHAPYVWNRDLPGTH